MVKNAREENARRGGWVRIFPTAETWPMYGSMLEFSSPNNQILHEHLFPDAVRKNPAFRAPQTLRKPKPEKPVKMNPTTEYRKRSASAGPGREKLINEDKIKNRENENESGMDSGEPESLSSNPDTNGRPRTSSGAVIMTNSASTTCAGSTTGSTTSGSSGSSTTSGIGSMSSEDDIGPGEPESPSSPPIPQGESQNYFLLLY